MVAIDRDGAFLDVGCARGYLMECVAHWSPYRVEPHGLDVAPGLVALACRGLPAWADRICLRDVLSWQPPLAGCPRHPGGRLSAARPGEIHYGPRKGMKLTTPSMSPGSSL